MEPKACFGCRYVSPSTHFGALVEEATEFIFLRAHKIKTAVAWIKLSRLANPHAVDTPQILRAGLRRVCGVAKASGTATMWRERNGEGAVTASEKEMVWVSCACNREKYDATWPLCDPPAATPAGDPADLEQAVLSGREAEDLLREEHLHMHSLCGLHPGTVLNKSAPSRR